jgi:hypothetical protein
MKWFLSATLRGRWGRLCVEGALGPEVAGTLVEPSGDRGSARYAVGTCEFAAPAEPRWPALWVLPSTELEVIC